MDSKYLEEARVVLALFLRGLHRKPEVITLGRIDSLREAVRALTEEEFQSLIARLEKDNADD